MSITYVSNFIQAWVFQPVFLIPEGCKELARKISIVSKEAFATLTGYLPNRISWGFRSLFLHTIQREKEIPLYSHSQKSFNPSTSAVLFLHGDMGHPATLLSLIDDTCKSYPTFSMHLFYDEAHPENHRKLIDQAINCILKQYPSPIIMVGHSRGAIEASFFTFCKEDPRIKTVISIAGRLAHPEDPSCANSLKPTIAHIERAIYDHPSIPLYQIVAGDDWNAPRKACLVREATAFIVDRALHLNILFAHQTRTFLKTFLLQERPKRSASFRQS